MNKPTNNQSIAIIGLSCRFPQANTPQELWQLLFDGKSVIDKVPAERWNIDDYFDPDKETPGKTNQNQGAFLKNIHHFDPYFFNVSPKEAIEMSPSQKVMMELSWELFESSTLKKNQFYGSRTGVFVGNIWAGYEHLRKARRAEINNFSAIGQSANVIANRISYHFGLTGPSLVLDTGCSSSLVAIDLAVRSLRDNTSDMCIAGGVNIIIDPDEYVYLAKFGGLSSKGKCSTFDADADGFVRGEGAGALLLKRLEDAERDGDKIYAVIRGGAVTNNGYNVNMPATSREGQIEVLAQAYKDAGVMPAEVDFIEAHGTGTRLGDPVETGALGDFFAPSRQNDIPLLVGSIKTNLGHCESSSGIAGVLKTIMAFQHRTLPKNLNFNTPNPEIDFEGLKVKVPTENIPLTTDKNKNLIAGVSSYGWGGTNVHVVLEEYRPKADSRLANTIATHEFYFLPLSAKTPKALQDFAGKYAQFISENESKMSLAAICASTAIQKTDFEYKKLFFGRTSQELIASLSEFHQSQAVNISVAKNSASAKVVFVFPGQGAQWFSMGKELYQKEPAFKAAIDACDKAFSKYVDWSLIDEIHATPETSKLQSINVVQPYLMAMQVALAWLWMSKGVQPASVVGHSMGEVAAAYIAGTLTLDDAANIICTRSILMNTLSGKGGAMAVTELNKEQAEALVEKYNGKISLAVLNSPKSTVLAGDNQIIEEILADLNEQNLFCRQVKVDVASHSPQMDLIKDELFEKVKHVKPLKSQLNIYSTVRNQKLSGEEMDAEYWKCNLRNGVMFSSVTQQLLTDGHQIFIEVSPHPVLSTAIGECAQHYNYPNVSIIGSLHRENPSSDEMAKNFGLLYEAGYPIDWAQYFQTDKMAAIELPSYPLQKENYEIKDLSSHFENGKGNSAAHPLIGNRIKLADSTDYYWESKISLYNLPFLAHHQVNGVAVFPGGFYIEMIHAAAQQVDPQNSYFINDLEFIQSVELTDAEAVNLQLKIESNQALLASFKVYKQIADDQSWELVCLGTLQPAEKHAFNPFHLPNSVQIKITKADIYNSFRKLGVTFKETFQNIEKIDLHDDVVFAVINLSDNDSYKPDHYSIPPMLLDNCLHPLFTKAFSEVDHSTVKITFVQGIKQVKIGTITSDSHLYYVKANLQPLEVNHSNHTMSITGDIFVYDNHHQLVLELTGVNAKIIDTLMERTEKADNVSDSVLEAVLAESSDAARKVIIEEYLIHLVADASKASPDQLDTTMTFKNMGIDSLTTVQLRNKIEKQFDVKLVIKLFYQYPSIGEFSNVLVDLLKDHATQNNLPLAAADKWLTVQKANKDADKLLFLFHDAGGSIRLFENWETHIDHSTVLITIQLPGRDDRTNEPLMNNLNPLLEELLPLMNEKIGNKPFFIYGHSMGGLMAFEAARRLQHQYGKHAQELIVSGTPCLKGYENHFVNNIFAQNYSDEQLLSLIISSESDLDINKSGVKELVKMLRNDFELIHGYRYNDMPALNCKITAIHAKEDDRVDVEKVKLWQSETHHDFSLIVVDGGHNFVYTHSVVAPSLINNAIINYKTIKN